MDNLLHKYLEIILKDFPKLSEAGVNVQAKYWNQLYLNPTFSSYAADIREERFF